MNSIRKTPKGLNQQNLRGKLTLMTDLPVVSDIAVQVGANPGRVIDTGSNVTSIYTGTAGTMMGALRLSHGIEMSAKTDEEKTVKAVIITAGVTQTTGGLVKIAGNAVSLAGSKVVATAAKTGLAAASRTTLKIGGGVSSLYIALIMIPVCMDIDKKRKMLEKLEKNDSTIDMEKLKGLAPNTFKKLNLEDKVYKDLTLEAKSEIKKEIEKSQVDNGAALAVLLLTLIGAVLGIVFTGGAGALVAAIVGIVAGVAMAGYDASTMVKALQSAKVMGNAELVIKSLMIILGVVSLVLSVVFAPTLALAIAAGVVGALLVAVPLISVIVMKAKEVDLLKQEEVDRIANRKGEARALISSKKIESLRRHISAIDDFKIDNEFEDSYEYYLKIMAEIKRRKNKPTLSMVEHLSRITVMPDLAKITINRVRYSQEEMRIAAYMDRKSLDEKRIEAIEVGVKLLDSLAKGTKTTVPKANLFKALMVDTDAGIKSKMDANQEPFSKFPACKSIKKLEALFKDDSELKGLIQKFSVRHTV